MKTKFGIGIVICLLMMITLVSATTLGTYKQNDCVDLKQNCASCSYVNFTRISYPDSSVAIRNVELEKDGSAFNYTFCNTSQLGVYIVEGVADVDGVDTAFAYDFEIKQEGRMNMVLLLGLFALILLGVAYLFESEYISFISGCLFIVLGIYTMIYGIDALPDMYTRTIAFTSIGLGFIFTIASAFRAIESE